MKNVSQIINTTDVATKEYADTTLVSTTAIQKQYLTNMVNEYWSMHTFIADESNANIWQAIYKKGTEYWKIFATGAVYLTTDPNFDPNKQFFYYGYDRDGNLSEVEDFVRLENIITLKQKNNPANEVTLYAWQKVT